MFIKRRHVDFTQACDYILNIIFINDLFNSSVSMMSSCVIANRFTSVSLLRSSMVWFLRKLEPSSVFFPNLQQEKDDPESHQQSTPGHMTSLMTISYRSEIHILLPHAITNIRGTGFMSPGPVYSCFTLANQSSSKP